MRKTSFGVVMVGLCLVVCRGPVCAGDRVTSPPANVQIDVPADVPVHIVNFHFDPAPAGMTAFHYDVENASGQGMVALEARWKVQSGGPGSATFSNRDDRWLTGEQLAAGESEHFQVSNVPVPASGTSGRLAMTISYAEFEDGTRLGADAAQVGREIDAARRAEQGAYARLLATFDSGGSEALAGALKQGTVAATNSAAAFRDASAVQGAMARLGGILNSQGMDAAVMELRRVSALSLPELR